MYESTTFPLESFFDHSLEVVEVHVGLAWLQQVDMNVDNALGAASFADESTTVLYSSLTRALDVGASLHIMILNKSNRALPTGHQSDVFDRLPEYTI